MNKLKESFCTSDCAGYQQVPIMRVFNTNEFLNFIYTSNIPLILAYYLKMLKLWLKITVEITVILNEKTPEILGVF